MSFVTMPTVGIASIEWTMPDPLVFMVRSGWTGAQTIGDLGGITEGWRAKVTLITKRQAHLNVWRAFFAGMRGGVNVTTVPAVEADQVASGAIFTTSATTNSYTNAVTGLPASQTPYLPAGALATIYTLGGGVGSRLVTLTADLNTNGSGAGTLSYAPSLPSVAAGTNLYLQRPSCSMRLVRGAAGWSVSPGQLYTPSSFELTEVL